MTHPGLTRRDLSELLKRLPPIRWWVEPEWILTDLDYGNRVSLVLNAKHPVTKGSVQIGSREFHRWNDPKPHLLALIEEAEKLAPAT